MRKRGPCFALALLLFLAVQAGAAEVCFDCHEANPQDTSRTSFGLLPNSAHAGLSCTDCHSHVNLEDQPSEAAREVECAS